MKGACIPSKYKFKTQKNNKLKWLASNIISNCWTLGVLSLLVIRPKFNTISDEDGVIDQSYLLLLKSIIVGLKNVRFKEK